MSAPIDEEELRIYEGNRGGGGGALKSALQFLVAPTREWQPSPPEDEQNAICTKSCDIIFMKIKVIRFAFKNH